MFSARYSDGACFRQMAADAFQWTVKATVHQMIAAANDSKQKMFETGKADYVAPLGLNDEQSKEEFVGEADFPEMAEETYDYCGRDGYRGLVAVENFTNIHVADQPMQSLFSLCFNVLKTGPSEASFDLLFVIPIKCLWKQGNINRDSLFFCHYGALFA
ncbi:hypothetical protein VSAK1_24995 [Vibrio mediterranei AK1]|nr:hypothetical protein VSAK1_24995 [Vibrio mediterranei AK1]